MKAESSTDLRNAECRQHQIVACNMGNRASWIQINTRRQKVWIILFQLNLWYSEPTFPNTRVPTWSWPYILLLQKKLPVCSANIFVFLLCFRSVNTENFTIFFPNSFNLKVLRIWYCILVRICCRDIRAFALLQWKSQFWIQRPSRWHSYSN